MSQAIPDDNVSTLPSIEQNVDAGHAHLILRNEQTLRNTEALHSALLDARAHSDLTVDCSAVTEADLSLAQLLLSARKSALGQSRRLVVLGDSIALRDVMRRAGLTDAADAAFANGEDQ